MTIWFLRVPQEPGGEHVRKEVFTEQMMEVNHGKRYYILMITQVSVI